MVRLPESLSARFDQLSERYVNAQSYQEMKKYIAHGRISVYEHCINVARLSYKLFSFLKLKDEESLVAGALLHDYYLYDWHDKSVKVPLFKMHGYTHPFTAAENAARDFKVNDKVRNMICSHMWPLTLRTLPGSKEAWILCLCDKLIALKEVFTR